MDAPQPRLLARSRAWCYTLNNYVYVPTLSDWGPTAVYHCFGEEVGESGTPHLQGFVYLRNAVGLDRLRNVLPGAHFEVARGTPEQNRGYCSKDGIFTEEGTFPAQGKRNDLLALKHTLDSGSSLSDVADEHFSSFIRYQKGITAYRLVRPVVRSWAMEIEVYWGPTGCGKSRTVFDKYPYAYWKPAGPWWDGYDGHETVVLDEFYGSQLVHTELLRLLDRYPYSVPVKGGFIPFSSRRVIFTSNAHPRDWYGPDVWHADSWEHSPLYRRLMTGHIYDLHNLALWGNARVAAAAAEALVAIAPEAEAEPPAEPSPEDDWCPVCGAHLAIQGDCVFCHI